MDGGEQIEVDSFVKELISKIYAAVMDGRFTRNHRYTPVLEGSLGLICVPTPEPSAWPSNSPSVSLSSILSSSPSNSTSVSPSTSFLELSGKLSEKPSKEPDASSNEPSKEPSSMGKKTIYRLALVCELLVNTRFYTIY